MRKKQICACGNKNMKLKRYVHEEPEFKMRVSIWVCECGKACLSKTSNKRLDEKYRVTKIQRVDFYE